MKNTVSDPGILGNEGVPLNPVGDKGGIEAG